VLASPSLHWRQVSDALACAALLRSSAKMGVGSVALALLGLVSSAWFAQLARVSSR
jgi:hypothetical protein